MPSQATCTAIRPGSTSAPRPERAPAAFMKTTPLTSLFAPKGAATASGAASMSRTRVAKRGEFVIERLDVLEQLLVKWAAWMRTGGGVEGLPHASSLLSGGGGESEDNVEIMIEADERRLAAVTDSVIGDISRASPAQGNAIHHTYLNAVYRFSERYPYEQALADAMVALRAGLKRRNVAGVD